jgi:2-C-methyl-D-erythritol 4-phosphate cytidylyltransferase
MSPANVSVLIPAAGSGDRLGLGPKAFLPLGERRVVEWVIAKAGRMAKEVIVACPPGAPALDPALAFTCIAGGVTRQDSVRLLATQAGRGWVIVWDAARPFTSVALAGRVLAQALLSGGAAAACSGHDEFHTPLAFPRELLLQVTQRAASEGWAAPSTIGLVRRAGLDVATVANESHNIKLTTAADWALAQGLRHHLG